MTELAASGWGELPALILLTFFCVLVCSVRPGTEGEGTGAALTHTGGHQQKPELHGQILRAAGELRAEGRSWLVVRESAVACRTLTSPSQSLNWDPTQQ